MYQVSKSGSSKPFKTLTTAFQLVVVLIKGPGIVPLTVITYKISTISILSSNKKVTIFSETKTKIMKKKTQFNFFKQVQCHHESLIHIFNAINRLKSVNYL